MTNLYDCTKEHYYQFTATLATGATFSFECKIDNREYTDALAAALAERKLTLADVVKVELDGWTREVGYAK